MDLRASSALKCGNPGTAFDLCLKRPIDHVNTPWRMDSLYPGQILMPPLM